MCTGVLAERFDGPEGEGNLFRLLLGTHRLLTLAANGRSVSGAEECVKLGLVTCTGDVEEQVLSCKCKPGV